MNLDPYQAQDITHHSTCARLRLCPHVQSPYEMFGQCSMDMCNILDTIVVVALGHG